MSTLRNRTEIAKAEHRETIDARAVTIEDSLGSSISSSNPFIVREQNSRRTTFEEFLVANLTSRFNFKPTWGVSVLRDSVDTSGTSATVDFIIDIEEEW